MKLSPLENHITLIAGLFLLVIFSASPSQAGCTNLEYDHNRSTMEVDHCEFGTLNISYKRPRRVIRNQGVRNGTLFFNGSEDQSGHISGKARAFSRRCGEVSYQVTGFFRNDSAIILQGHVPVRNKSCVITRYRLDKLVFTLPSSTQPAPAPNPPVVQPTCPPGFFLQGGQCLRAGGNPGSGAQRNFTRNIVGSRWTYPYGGKNYQFTFGQNTIDNFSNGWWPGVTWNIIRRNELELWNPANGKTMSITFLSPNRFRALNWGDNVAVMGNRIGGVARPAPRPAPIPAPRPAPRPAPIPSRGDWHAVAGSFPSFNKAQKRVNQLGANDWYVMNSSNCPNFTSGYFIATMGPFNTKRRAQKFANQARRHGAYVKRCN